MREASRFGFGLLLSRTAGVLERRSGRVLLNRFSGFLNLCNLCNLWKGLCSRRGSIIGNAAVLKTAARKGLQVRVLSPPPLLQTRLFPN